MSVVEVERPHPLAFPLLVDRAREQVTSEKLGDRIRRMVAPLERAAERTRFARGSHRGFRRRRMSDVMLTIVGRVRTSAAAPREGALSGRAPAPSWWRTCTGGRLRPFAPRASLFREARPREDLARLKTRPFKRTGARRLLVLGDLFHARAGRVATRTLGDAPRMARAAPAELEIQLVRGNHDRHAGDPQPVTSGSTA